MIYEILQHSIVVVLIRLSSFQHEIHHSSPFAVLQAQKNTIHFNYYLDNIQCCYVRKEIGRKIAGLRSGEHRRPASREMSFELFSHYAGRIRTSIHRVATSYFCVLLTFSRPTHVSKTLKNVYR